MDSVVRVRSSCRTETIASPVRGQPSIPGCAMTNPKCAIAVPRTGPVIPHGRQFLCKRNFAPQVLRGRETHLWKFHRDGRSRFCIFHFAASGLDNLCDAVKRWFKLFQERSSLGSKGLLVIGKKRKKISDKSETCLLGKTEGWIDSWVSQPQAEIVAANEMPPINMAIIVNRKSTVKPP